MHLVIQAVSVYPTLALSANLKRNKSYKLYSSAKKEPAAQKSKPKPKVVSLFDDDGGEEEDWFDNINPTKKK